MPPITKILIAGAVTLAGGVAAAFIAAWLAWGRGDGAVAEPMPDFSTLVLSEKPNQYLALPPGFVSTAPPHEESPVFDLPVAVLEQRALKAIRGQPRVMEVAADPARRQYAFVQRTPVLRFPDTVTVRFVDLGDGRSSVAMYSRSKVGYSDLGANEARVGTWLAAIAAVAGGG